MRVTRITDRTDSLLMEASDLTRMLGRPIDLTHLRLARKSKHEPGNCFEAAAFAVVAPERFGLLACGIDAKDWFDKAVLVHALITGQGPLEGKPHTHAWVEYNGVAFDLSNNRAVVMPVPFFRAVARLQRVEPVTYSYKETAKHLLTQQHFGPWDDNFIEAADEAEGGNNG